MCPHLLQLNFGDSFAFHKGGNSICDYASSRLGRPFVVNSDYCEKSCKVFGPYGGRVITEENHTRFMVQSFRCMFDIVGLKPGKPGWFVKKVLNAYKSKMDVCIPDAWSDIRKQLSHLYDLPFITKILVTGSLVSKRTSHKDYDIVLCITSYRDINDKEFYNKLPRRINDVPVDYFITSQQESVLFFITLDCDKKILYTSKWFDLKLSTIESGIAVQECNTQNMSVKMCDELEKIYSS